MDPAATERLRAEILMLRGLVRESENALTGGQLGDHRSSFGIHPKQNLSLRAVSNGQHWCDSGFRLNGSKDILFEDLSDEPHVPERVNQGTL